MKWTISTGGEEYVVEVPGKEDGDGAFAACVEAVKTLHFKRIGQLIQAVPEGYTEDDDEHGFYCSGESVCEAAGLLVK